jgi:hypothetical protein
MINKLISAVLIISIIILPSCNKDEGIGGKGSIKGKVVIRNYNTITKIVESSYPAEDQNVFIIFGDNTSYGDKASTSYDGSFEFKYLTDGKYTIYTYSDDSAGTSNKKMAVIEKVNISGEKSIVLDTLIIYKNLDIEKGTSTITGTITANVYDTKSLTLMEEGIPAQDIDIYLAYNDTLSFDLRTRTDYKGVFKFKNLIKGRYTIYFYSEKIINSIIWEEKNVVKHVVIIDKMNQIISFKDKISVTRKY